MSVFKCDKDTLDIFLIDFSLILTSQIRLVFKISLPYKELIKWFVFETVQNTHGA